VGRTDERLILPRADGLGRRQFLGGLAVVGAGGLLAACGSSGGAGTATATPTASSAAKRRAATCRWATGGSGHDTLDPHQGLTYLDTARAQQLYQPLVQLNAQAQIEYVLRSRSPRMARTRSGSSSSVRASPSTTKAVDGR